MLAQRHEALIEPCVDELMTARPIVVSARDSIAVAVERLRAGRVRHLPVMDGSRLVGLITLRDVLLADASASVADVTRRPIWTVSPAVGIRQACELLLAPGISCLPVVDGGVLVGIFTRTDALKFVLSVLDLEQLSNRGGPTVAQLMTSPPTEVTSATTTLDEAWRQMRATQARYLPVMCLDAVIGILGERDVLLASRLAPNGSMTSAPLVVDAMSPGVRLIRDESSAWEAARSLLKHRSGALVVLHDSKLRGVITGADFLRWLLRART